MRERWLGLVARIADKSQWGAAHAVFDDLLDRYNAADRRYHNLSHIDACLKLLDTVRPLAQRPDALELAIWFHDAI